MSSPQRNIRVIISGGGTGGHIFPAIAIANAIRKINDSSEILFVGAKGRMEMEKVPAAGYRIEGLDISGLQRKLSLKNLLLPLKVLRSVMRSKSIIRTFRPDAAVGVGGYASGPLLYAATSMGIPSVIQEQNSYAGITNKLLSKRVRKIFVAYPGMEKYFPAGRISFTGNPVRQDIEHSQCTRSQAIEFFGLNAGRKTVLVLGGSLGARTINESILNGLDALSDYQVVWQTGKLFYTKAKEAAEKYPGVKVYDFIQRMDMAYAAADVVISRSGAGTVSELSIAGLPSILVPSPNVAEDHQTKNAKALSDRNAALLVSDSESSSMLVAEAVRLLNDEKLREDLSKNISALAKRNSAEIIAREIYGLILNSTEN